MGACIIKKLVAVLFCFKSQRGSRESTNDNPPFMGEAVHSLPGIIAIHFDERALYVPCNPTTLHFALPLFYIILCFYGFHFAFPILMFFPLPDLSLIFSTSSFSCHSAMISKRFQEASLFSHFGVHIYSLSAVLMCCCCFFTTSWDLHKAENEAIF